MAVPGDKNYLTLNYLVYLADKSQAELLNSQNPSGISLSPREASTLYSAPISGIDYGGGAVADPPRIDIVGGYSASSALAIDVRSVDYPANTIPDAFGILRSATNQGPASGPSPFVGGTIAWRGDFLWQGASPATTTNNRSVIRYQQGFELEENEEGANAFLPSFDASRVTGHRGLALRSTANTSGVIYTPPTDVYESQWTQFYIRPRILIAQGEIYRTEGRTGVFTTLGMELDTSGTVLIYHSPGGVKTLLATVGTLPIDAWSRIDIMENFNAQNASTGADAGATWDIYINKSLVASVQSGFTNAQYIFQSTLCRIGLAAGTAGQSIDFDDWTIRAFPTSVLSPVKLDWDSGTHIVPIRGSILASDSSGNWSGTTGPFDAYRSSKSNVGKTASINGSILSISIDEYDPADIQLGIVGAFIGVNNISSTTATGSTVALRGTITVAGVSSPFTFASNSFTMTSLAPSGNTIDVTPLDGNLPVRPDSISIAFTPGTFSGSTTLTCLHGTLACLGTWGTVDDPDGVSTNFDPHQSVYPKLGYTGTNGNVKPAVVAQEQGTYVGNDTVTEISFVTPPSFVYIHRNGFEPAIWHSAMETGRAASNHIVDCDLISRVKTNIDINTKVPTGFTLRICGNDAKTNANGQTYRYIAFCDPGGRFVRNTIATQSDNQLTTVKTTAIKDFQFSPEGGFLHYATNGVSNASTTFYKGVGHTAENASILNGAEAATTCAFSQGGLSIDTNGFALSEDRYILGNLWRSIDNNGDDGAVDLVTYTGDGTGARTITVDLNGRIPALAIVVPHNGTSYHKHAGLTGSNSQIITTGANSTTAITALGADSVTIGATLNANLVVYDVFVISGGATGADSLFFPAATAAAPAGPYVSPDPNGWWLSTEGFTGSVSVIGSTQRPYAPRDWTKLANWAAGGATYLGGFPAASAVFNNHIIYPANGYSIGVDQPPMRIFDGITDRELITIPVTSSAAIPKAILSMLRNGDTIYVSTYDSGTTSADFAGRVFSYNVLANTLTPLGSGFSGGELPYAMCWHMGRLWVGTNKNNGTAGKIYFIRPGIDTDWTTDHNLSADSVGGAVSLASYGGKLYVGSDNAAGSFAKVLVRDTLGAYTTSLTATGGTARVNNGFTYLIVHPDVFGTDQLIAGYWNPDTTAVAKVYKFDGTTWTTPYAGSSGSLRPYILMFKAVDNLYILGGAKDRSAFMMRTDDLTTFTNLTAFLYGPITETIIPTFGVV